MTATGDGLPPLNAAAQIEALYRSRLTTFTGSHRSYASCVGAELEETFGIDSSLEQSGMFMGDVRATVIWFDMAGLSRAEWTETTGWSLHRGQQVGHAPLPVLADPAAAAQWIASVVAGRPVSGNPPEPRTATRASSAEEALPFETHLLAYSPTPAFRDLIPKLLPAMAGRRPRHGLAWNAELVHHCNGCPPGGERPWTREASARPTRVVITREPATAYTGWCEICQPDPLRVPPANIIRFDEQLVSAHEAGEIRGSLLLSLVDKLLCSGCLAPWVCYPGATLPLGVGELEELGLRLHPCPWCWEANEADARSSQEWALAHKW